MATPPPAESGYQLWYYYPSLPGNIAFAALFAALSIMHLIGLGMHRLKFCIPLLIGGIFEVIGYGIRAYAHSQTSNVPIYAAQSLLILLAPILFAASVYMYLGRLMTATNATELSPIPVQYLTKTFFWGDVLCFAIQAVGGSMQSIKSMKDKMYIAEYIILGGLILQICIFGVFVVVAVVVHMRMARRTFKEGTIAWEKRLVGLYVVSGLICLRNIFRAVEYGLGSDGYLLGHEWPGFVFDGALMVLALTICGTWYLGSGAKLNSKYDGYAKTTELDYVRSSSPMSV